MLREQDRVVRAHAIDEGNRHAAARVTESRILVVFRQGEQRQCALDRRPGIGTELLLLRENTRVLEVGDADVVGGKRMARSSGTCSRCPPLKR